MNVNDAKSGASFVGYLHKSHLDAELKKVKRVKVKDLNYFDQYPVLTAIPAEINSISCFNDILVGEVYEGTVQKVIKSPLTIVVCLGENVTGTIDA